MYVCISFSALTSSLRVKHKNIAMIALVVSKQVFTISFIIGTMINKVKDTKKNDLSLAFIQDTYPDNPSEASSATVKESRKSSKSTISLPPLALRKEPVYDEIFVDFSNMDLKQFPTKILNSFPHLRVLYFFK